MRYLCLVMSWLFAGGLAAATWTVDDGPSLQHALATAKADDELVLQPGTYQGHFVVAQTLTIRAEPGAQLDALGRGAALTIRAKNVRVSGLTISHFGASLYDRDAGILVEAGSDNVRLHHNIIRGGGFGIRADEVNKIEIAENQIEGNERAHKLDRGDGIYLNYVTEPQLHGNHIRHVRDGIYLENVSGSRSWDNQFSDQQYGIHYMYTQDDEAWHNQARRVDGGYALMSANNIHLHHNQVWNASDFGILLNLTHKSELNNNQVFETTNPKGEVALMTEGKGIFIYGAKDNVIYRNLFQANDTGINMAMGGEGNRVWLNQFIDNHAAVKYVGDTLLEWSYQGQGNYWSGYQGWDFNQDGLGDLPYQPNDSLDRLFWLYPELTLLLDSPVVALLRWLEQQFTPASGQGVRDSAPLMHAHRLDQRLPEETL
ncbi:nitrous oxide reductase family maturation protein NosD [Shewanella sp. NIFS-20-20]|uniref:nitrous oxide reductase family maturation protein NosD n=1 Tax=Shewanella sp. NIFS-20-20 TaxID=2853806 RepID=UPI001C453007|nr:nitrous oxide reductase family maturation protein NosD [Shewanella sp. NIFS-20-20]MBV7317462.1 nitrous oxide reductase family maturation protein NosD [Shewanella sp. NIFS-20-20]